MGREVKRVPVGFDWPQGKVWEGYVSPDYRPCPSGDCENGSTTAGRWLECITHVLMLAGENSTSGRDMHPWLREVPLAPARLPGADMAELTTGLAGRSPSMFGHDACDRWSAASKIVKAAGLPETWGICQTCKGNAIHPDDQEASEAWRRTDPPAGDGWQLWETVSEGSPISPVFPTAAGLAAWMSGPGRGRDWLTPEAAAKFIEAGWAPTFMASPETGVVSGAEFIGTRESW